MNEQNTPLSQPIPEAQIQALGGLVQGLSTEQLIYIEGFIRGIRQASGGTTTPATAPATVTTVAKRELTILYGTESGNSETLANTTAKKAKALGFTPKVVNMADTSPTKLKSVENLLVLVSTWGEGDPPESALAYHEDLLKDSAPQLPNLRYSVLALGDTSYEQFCEFGKVVDQRLEKLGATRFLPRVDCDVDYDEAYATWVEEALAELDKLTAPSGGDVSLAAPVTPAVAPAVEAYGRKNPFPSELSEKVLLNGKGSAKETYHFELSLEGSGLTYAPGDSLAVIPHNAGDVVDQVIEASGLDRAALVNLKGEQFTLERALTSKLDITTLTLPVMKRYAELAKHDQLNALLEPKSKTKLLDYMNGRDVADLLRDFPCEQLTADAFVAIMRKLPPRLYSIASSPKAHPGEVHLTVAVVRYDAHGRKRKGVCSTYLADRLAEGEKAEVFVTANKNFKLPDDPEAPIIMVGPGTGIAPFRAFVEERAATSAKGKNWLFFGDQHYLTDFLYQTEWQSYLEDGVLTKLDVAFSRDQLKKIYVQDRMRERAKELFAWIEAGAYFYVCGDATRMAVDVDQALHEIIASEGKLSDEAAAEYVKRLKAEKRYLRDVY